MVSIQVTLAGQHSVFVLIMMLLLVLAVPAINGGNAREMLIYNYDKRMSPHSTHTPGASPDVVAVVVVIVLAVVVVLVVVVPGVGGGNNNNK